MRRVYTHQRDKITVPVLTNRMLAKEPDRAWGFIDEHFFCVRDENGIPLSAWARATANMIPKPDYEDPATNYVTLDRKLIERSPINQKDRIGQATNVLEEYFQTWADNLKAANPIVWEHLFRILGEIDVWEHTKGTQRLWNGRKAYCNISMSLFGDNIVFFWSECQKNQIAALKDQGEFHNFTWSDFVNGHLAFHNHRAVFNYCASELGHVVTQWTKCKKICYLLNDISEGFLKVSKCAILADQYGLRSKFASDTQYVIDFIQSTSTASSSKNRTISEVRGDRTGSCNQNGQGVGKETTHGGRGNGVVGQGGKRKWSQEDIDACTHLTEQRYSNE